ncbi:MMPL family transporter [Paenibacillus sp. FSL P2-0136]|uniref:MMPL family transporter n=1 Tax=Paenibacillus sp. FSL P2-0136 TaxID=2975317 RepID=UPI0030DAB040
MNDSEYIPKNSESEKGQIILLEQLKYSPTKIILVYESESKISSSTIKDNLNNNILKSIKELEKLNYFTGYSSKQPTERQVLSTRDLFIFELYFNLSTDEALNHYQEIQAQVSEVKGTKLYWTGDVPTLYESREAGKKDISRAELIGLPLTLSALLFIFGSVGAAILPIIVGITTAAITMGIGYFIAGHMPISSHFPNLVTMLGLALGIDYALLMVNRFREELGRNLSIEQAVVKTAGSAGRSIVFSGLAVTVALASMFLIDLSFFRSIAIGGVLVVFFSVLVSNTVLLSLLSIFGKHLDFLSVLHKGYLNSSDESGFWKKVAFFVTRKKPIVLVLATSIFLLVTIIPVFTMKMGIPEPNTLPSDYPSRQGYERYLSVYGDVGNKQIQIVVTLEESLDHLAPAEALYNLTKKIRGVSDILTVSSPFELVGGSTKQESIVNIQNSDNLRRLEELRVVHDRYVVITAVSAYNYNDARIDRVIQDIRNLEFENVEVHVTGSAAVKVDLINRIKERVDAVLYFVFFSTFIILFFAFRSLVLPLKAVLLNFLSIGSSLGLIVLIVQYGIGSELFQMPYTGFIMPAVPIILFCVVFGISMDYEVFLLSRIAEEYKKSGDNTTSTERGLIHTGNIITSAAFVFILIVGVFIFTDIALIKTIGLGLVIAVFLDSTLVRIALVPALMRLLGQANWWMPQRFSSNRKTSLKKDL